MNEILSHNQRYPEIAAAARAVRAKVDASQATEEEKRRQKDILDHLLRSDFWSYLLLNGGLNGYFTDYIVQRRYLSKETEVEQTYFDLPAIKATQQRNEIFVSLLQKRLRSGIKIVSVPCGLMRDVLGLDFSGIGGFRIDGFDLDEESIAHAADLAMEYGLADHVRLCTADAWSLGVAGCERYDLCVSNGLNIYVKEDVRVIELYRSLHRCLKQGGQLITSALTWPPGQNMPCEWNMAAIDPQALALSKLIFAMFEPRWTSFRTIGETTAQLRRAGFSAVEIYPDEARMMPTFLARK